MQSRSSKTRQLVLALTITAVLIACNDQPTGRDIVDAAAPIANNPMPVAPVADPAASTQSMGAARIALQKSKMAKPQLIGNPFEDARAKLQPGQHFRFIAEFASSGQNWRATGQYNGRSLAYQLVTKAENLAGDWLVSGESDGFYRTGQNNYQRMGFQPDVQKLLMQAINAVPSSAASLSRAKDDFAGGVVAAKFSTQSSFGTLDMWLDERKSEFRKFTLSGSDQSLLTVELSDLGEPQVLPSPPKSQPW